MSRGILYMLLAALGFSVMGAAAKLLKGAFNAGQLVFYRNLIGLAFLSMGFLRKPPKQEGGKLNWLVFRGLMGAVALYTLLYCILHMPLGTAMTYNLTSSLHITVIGFFLFNEYHGRKVIAAVLLGFLGMLMVYKPGFSGSPWYYHLAGVISGLTSAIAYITVGRLGKYYDSRVIVLAFLLAGIILPSISFGLHYGFGWQEDGLFVLSWVWPADGVQWFYLLVLGLAALFGQYFVTLAYKAEKPSMVSAIGYSNILFSLIFGIMLGDSFPDVVSLIGTVCIILSGVLISFRTSKSDTSKVR